MCPQGRPLVSGRTSADAVGLAATDVSQHKGSAGLGRSLWPVVWTLWLATHGPPGQPCRGLRLCARSHQGMTGRGRSGRGQWGLGPPELDLRWLGRCPSPTVSLHLAGAPRPGCWPRSRGCGQAQGWAGPASPPHARPVCGPLCWPRGSGQCPPASEKHPSQTPARDRPWTAAAPHPRGSRCGYPWPGDRGTVGQGDTRGLPHGCPVLWRRTGAVTRDACLPWFLPLHSGTAPCPGKGSPPRLGPGPCLASAGGWLSLSGCTSPGVPGRRGPRRWSLGVPHRPPSCSRQAHVAQPGVLVGDYGAASSLPVTPASHSQPSLTAVSSLDPATGLLGADRSGGALPAAPPHGPGHALLLTPPGAWPPVMLPGVDPRTRVLRAACCGRF